MANSMLKQEPSRVAFEVDASFAATLSAFLLNSKIEFRVRNIRPMWYTHHDPIQTTPLDFYKIGKTIFSPLFAGELGTLSREVEYWTAEVLAATNKEATINKIAKIFEQAEDAAKKDEVFRLRGIVKRLRGIRKKQKAMFTAKRTMCKGENAKTTFDPLQSNTDNEDAIAPDLQPTDEISTEQMRIDSLIANAKANLKPNTPLKKGQLAKVCKVSEGRVSVMIDLLPILPTLVKGKTCYYSPDAIDSIIMWVEQYKEMSGKPLITTSKHRSLQEVAEMVGKGTTWVSNYALALHLPYKCASDGTLYYDESVVDELLKYKD